WNGRKVILLENVAEGPVAVAVYQSAGFEHRLHDYCCRVWFVVHWIARVGRRVPLRVVQRLAAHLPVYAASPITKHAALARGELCLRVIARLAERVRGIVVRAHEVGRYAGLFREVQELVDPRVVRR